MASFQYGRYSLKQTQGQHQFLQLIEIDYPQILKSLLENALPKVPPNLALHEKFPLQVRFENEELTITATLENPGSSRLTAVRTIELEIALIEWSSAFNLGQVPDWLFKSALDTLAIMDPGSETRFSTG